MQTFALQTAGWTAVGAFWCLCAGVLLLQTWGGWRQGLLRELSVVVALAAAWFVGRSHGASILVPLKSVVASLAVYVVVIIAGRLLFKRASRQPFGPARIFSGATGAVAGLLLGIFSVWLLVLGVRLAAALDEGQESNPLAAPLSEIKQSLESGLTGEIIRFTDPFPGKTYSDLNKIGRIATDPRLQQRMLAAPAFQKVGEDPKVVAFRRDPEAMNALQRRDYVALMRNPHLLAILNDSQLVHRLENLDMARLLKETVDGPAPGARAP